MRLFRFVAEKLGLTRLSPVVSRLDVEFGACCSSCDTPGAVLSGEEPLCERCASWYGSVLATAGRA